ncbi:MAG: orotate phosphoribosyltransferase [Candidatus Omnitrophica bacterium]|nr:orotate phosphoribosyltransferase [Candidatus Omnitrophota bacterium]
MEKLNEQQMRKRLLELIQRHALKRGKFILSSGKESSFYLDGRIITMMPEGSWLVASLMLEMLKDETVDAFGGPTLGADPIVGAVACLSFLNQRPLKTFIIRKQPKDHGRQQRIEGPALETNEIAVLVDDVATTGHSLIEAKQVLQELGVHVSQALVIVDRSEGAKENLAQHNINLRPIFTLKELGV